MTIRTKLICIGGPIHGKHVELDPRANDYRCETLEETGSLTWVELNDPTSLAGSTRHTYVRRCFSEKQDVITGEKTDRIEALVHASLTMSDALLKVFGYDE